MFDPIANGAAVVELSEISEPFTLFNRGDPMNLWTWFILYLKAARPSALAAPLKRREAEAYQRGWDVGFDKDIARVA